MFVLQDRVRESGRQLHQLWSAEEMPLTARSNCWNNRSPVEAGHWAQDGWKMNGSCEGESPNWVWVSHTMTTECQSDYPGCAGCKDFKGELNG